MNANASSFLRLGFDLRGLMALTSVAAFITLILKIDAGTAAIVTVAFMASAAMAYLHPVGAKTRHRAMGIVLALGMVIAFVAVSLQFLIFGSRLYVMWGTALAACFGIVFCAIAICKPIWIRWTKRIVFSTLILLIIYLSGHCVVYRDSIYLSWNNEVYFAPRFKFSQFDEQMWILNRLRFAFGLSEQLQIFFRHDVTASDWNALSRAGQIPVVAFNSCTIDFPPGQLANYNFDTVLFFSCKLRGNSMADLVSKSTFFGLFGCEIESFNGVSEATKLDWINVDSISMTDEFVDELIKLPKLRGINLDASPLSETQFERIRAAKNGLILGIK